MNGNERYLNAAIKIANTLAKKIKTGDNENSPLPFKVNAENGKVGVLIETVKWEKTITIRLLFIELGWYYAIFSGITKTKQRKYGFIPKII